MYCFRLNIVTLLPNYCNPISTLEEESVALNEILQDASLLSKCHLLLKCNKALVSKNIAEGPAFARLGVFANTPASEANIGALVVR